MNILEILLRLAGNQIPQKIKDAGQDAVNAFLHQLLHERMNKAQPDVVKRMKDGGFNVKGNTKTGKDQKEAIRSAEFLLWEDVFLAAGIKKEADKLADGIRDSQDDRIIAVVLPQLASVADDDLAKLVSLVSDATVHLTI